ncbi:DNA-3-methyladenine glycosylase family protein [Leucobacter tenebrionis]|uniref:DNA-3-methyladenine glycosylase family protein n=1 Tax=Leucobacter tenebrionis TaxID=2873270 RepID=UPI001CA6CEC2|nr:AlkA N-terminal domain-containing protein [Leucobacter tenebrionis]QZY51908.1 3-methyladenine DNA glycosylase [Leucobacter tenebrionis]
MSAEARTSAVSQIRIDADGPFDHDAALGTLAAHAVDGLHRVDLGAAGLTRWIDVHGDAHRVVVRLDADGATIATATHDTGVNAEIASLVRHWFDLDTDLAPVNARLGVDSVFTEQVASRPGIRITRFHAPFEAVILTVLGQQVSLAAGRRFAARLVAAYGTPAYGTHPTAGDQNSGLRCFPSPAILAATPVEELRAAVGLTGARARTVHEVAVLFSEADDSAALPARADLRRVRGIGPWTLDYLAIRAGGDPDAFPLTDAVLRRTLAVSGPGADAARVESWSPYRSYAASRLWARSL